MNFTDLFKKLGGKTRATVVRTLKGLSRILTDERSGPASRQRMPAGLPRGTFVPGHRGLKPGERTQPIPIPQLPAVPQREEREEREPEPPLDDFARELLAGEMHLVTSSNVHSIGMRIDSPGDTRGTLLIRYLGTHAGGARHGPGPLYEYYEVPVSLYREFLGAASKGVFVWDHVRVRGTVSGHRYRYDLVGLQGNNYVPRQAGLKRGQAGEWYLRRTFTLRELRNGKLVTVRLTSRLPERRVSLRGPNPERGPGAQGLRFVD